MNIGLMIVELEEEHLGDNQVGTAVVDHSLQKDDPILKETAVDVENTLFAAAPLDHVGNQGHGKFSKQPRPRGKSRQPMIWGDKKKGNSWEKGIRGTWLSQEKRLCLLLALFAC